MEEVRSSDGTTIAFERQGAGEPVLLVHGTTGSHESWALVVPHLAEHFAVVNMDRRWRGESGDGRPYSLDLEIDDVAAVIEAIGEPVHLVGHSFGARLGLEAAARGVSLRSLVAYEAVISPPEEGESDLVERAEALIRDGDVDGAAGLFLTEGAMIPAEEVSVLRGLAPVWERITTGVPTVPREARGLSRCPVDVDALRRITVPVLLLVGAETTAPIYLDGLDEIEQAIPDARRATIPGQRHMATGFAPELLAEIITSFLSKAKVD